MNDKKKTNLTKLHLYFFFIVALLMVTSSSFKFDGYVNGLLSTLGIAIFMPTILTERFAKKIEKDPSKNRHIHVGALLGAVEGGVITGILNFIFMPVKYGQIEVWLLLIFTGIGVITGMIVGFLITYLPQKMELEPIK